MGQARSLILGVTAQWTSLEIGALYINRNIYDQTIGNTESLHAVQVPVLLRWWFMPMVSVGVGGYFAQGIGSVSVNNGASVATSESFSAADLKTTRFWSHRKCGHQTSDHHPNMRLLIDGRYNYGLTNKFTRILLNLGQTIKNRDIQALVGLAVRDALKSLSQRTLERLLLRAWRSVLPGPFFVT